MYQIVLNHRHRSLLSAVVGVAMAALLAGFAVAADGTSASPEQIAFFDKEVLPLLKENCFKCHGDEPKVKGGLNLTTRAGLVKGGELGPAVDFRSLDKSLLLEMISYKDEDHEMPPKAKLPKEKSDVLVKWIKMGAPYSPDRAGTTVHLEGPIKIDEAARNWWAYRKLQRPAPPGAGANSAWVRSPIDAFILSKLQANKLKPVGPAPKVALLRRAYYDLIGLPPTPAEIDAFVADPSPRAFEKVLDKLLAMPQYGEKWGRHWLDLVRYAETNSYERDGTKPFAWRYRDYVIRAFNEDKPYDQFLREQIAGDELQPLTADGVIATGYYRLGLWDDEPVDRPQARADGLDDIVSTTSQVMLGTTVGCARCHDHKKDPIPQKDYYRLVAFFMDIRHFDNGGAASSMDISALNPTPAQRRQAQELAAKKTRIEKEIYDVEQEGIKQLKPEDQRASEGPDRPQVVKKLPQVWDEKEKKAYEKLKADLAAVVAEEKKPKEPALCVANCAKTPEDTFVLIRGSAHAQADKVTPGFPVVLGFPEPTIPTPGKDARSSGRRTVLADWIASKDNPLTARVMANRLWQHHFGRGLCRTSNDFGKLGELPTHTELLDWLAAEFMAKGWSMKQMHKLVMLSATYQMSSGDDADGLRLDPGNDLFWRFDMRRLTAEEVRDSILAVNGSLNLKMGGPSIYTEVPEAVLQTSSQPKNAWGKSPPQEQVRRSVYVFVKRSLVEPMLNTFDLADTDSSCAVRFATTVPTQSLTALNSDFFHKQSAVLAARLKKEAGAKVEDQLKLGLRLVTGRAPTAAELKRCVTLYNDLQQKDGVAADKAMDYVCLVMLNLNEFVYLD